MIIHFYKMYLGGCVSCGKVDLSDLLHGINACTSIAFYAELLLFRRCVFSLTLPYLGVEKRSSSKLPAMTMGQLQFFVNRQAGSGRRAAGTQAGGQADRRGDSLRATATSNDQ